MTVLMLRDCLIGMMKMSEIFKSNLSPSTFVYFYLYACQCDDKTVVLNMQSVFDEIFSEPYSSLGLLRWQAGTACDPSFQSKAAQLSASGYH